MLIISLFGFKGGVGKTTTAIHMAKYLEAKGRTLLVDADPNQSARDWAERGGDRFSVKVCDLFSLLKLAGKYDYIVVDTAARPSDKDIESIVEASNLIVLPTTPDALSVDVLIKTTMDETAVGGDDGPPRFVLMTMVDPSSRRNLGKEASEAIADVEAAQVLNKQVRRYSVFDKAAMAGVTVGDVSGDKKRNIAAKDYNDAFNELFKKFEALQVKETANV